MNVDEVHRDRADKRILSHYNLHFSHSQKYERKKTMHMKNHSSNFSIFGGSTKQKRKNSNNQPASLMSNIVALKLKHN